ncbi:MAG: glutamine synthetase beta-grasp domain-containing protein, partial [Acidimicrobiia bacterium]|nr:glutamine synthetase beta-grasp domain-containing protein [Acidimicrobiia bacterium]
MAIRAEYIWIDGSEPTQKLRAKTKVLFNGDEPPIWGFDGSSTNQAPGNQSDCVLNPVKIVPDPIRGGDDVLVLCEVRTVDLEPHPSNTRAACVAIADQYGEKYEPWFGIEQEYTFFKEGRPFGFPQFGYPAPQGGYYCGIGSDEIFGREIVEDHLDNCIKAGLSISGINAEVMIGQWEFQIGPLGPVEASDEIWLARYLLYRSAEAYDVAATLDPKPVKGDWNGAGAHTNFSTKQMRESYDPIIAGAEA